MKGSSKIYVVQHNVAGATHNNSKTRLRRLLAHATLKNWDIVVVQDPPEIVDRIGCYPYYVWYHHYPQEEIDTAKSTVGRSNACKNKASA